MLSAITRRKWTIEDEKKVLSLFKTTPVKELAQILNRTPKSITLKYASLSSPIVYRKGPWLPLEDKIISDRLSNYDPQKPIPWTDISLEIGRCPASVRCRWGSIKPGLKKGSLNSDEIQEITDALKDVEISKPKTSNVIASIALKHNRSYSAIYTLFLKYRRELNNKTPEN